MPRVRRFGFFVLVALALAGPTLFWPMVYDDLHLIRPLEARELRAAWTGTWDPDGIETPGYRPLSTLFNHLRAVGLGQSATAHRLFAALLLAGYAALLARLAVRLGLDPLSASAGTLLFLCARTTVFHHVWLTNANHMLQGFAFLCAAELLIDGIERDSLARLAGSAAAMGGALLIREDSLAAFPALALIGLGSLEAATRRGRARFFGYLAVLAAAGLTLLAWRAALLPDAPAPGLDGGGFLLTLARALLPGGVDDFDAASAALRLAWLALLALLPLALALTKTIPSRSTLSWLASAAFAATTGLTAPREDILFFAASFASLGLASACADLARSGGRCRYAPLALAVAMLGGLYAGQALAENFHPASTKALWWNTRMLFGPFRDKATIPEATRRVAADRLAALGIRRFATARAVLRQLRLEAEAEGRRRPDGDRPFLPILSIEEF